MHLKQSPDGQNNLNNPENFIKIGCVTLPWRSISTEIVNVKFVSNRQAEAPQHRLESLPERDLSRRLFLEGSLHPSTRIHEENSTCNFEWNATTSNLNLNEAEPLITSVALSNDLRNENKHTSLLW